VQILAQDIGDFVDGFLQLRWVCRVDPVLITKNGARASAGSDSVESFFCRFMRLCGAGRIGGISLQDAAFPGSYWCAWRWSIRLQGAASFLVRCGLSGSTDIFGVYLTKEIEGLKKGLAGGCEPSRTRSCIWADD